MEEMKLQGSIKEIEDAKHQHLVKELMVKTISIRGLCYFQAYESLQGV